jgi:hypothetical protein
LSEILTLRLYDNKYNLLHFQLLGYKKLGLFKTILDVNNLESGRYQVIIQFNKNSISNIFDIESHLYGFRN